MQKLIKFLKNTWVLLLMLLLASLLRIYGVTSTPPSLNWDEISHGYNAYSILETGKDEWGVAWPTIFRAYGDYKLPVYIYTTALSEALFGLNAFAVRLPSVIAGIFVVLFTYLLAYKLFEKRYVAFLSALLVAIEPWSFFLSRGAFEANLGLAFIVSGAYFFLVGAKKAKYLPISAVLLGLSVWAYNSARIFVPLLLVLLVFLYKKELARLWKKQQKFFTFSILIFALFFLPMLWQLANPAGQARYGWVAILDEGAIAQINEARTVSTLPGILPTLLHNKVTYFIPRFLTNYFSHFSLDFLFLKGGSHFQFNVPGRGLLYLVNLPFFILGLFYLAREQSRGAWLVLGWLLLAPIPSSLTREAPHTLRAITMLPVPMLISAIGLVGSYHWWKEKVKKWQYKNAWRVIPLIAYFIVLAALAEIYLLVYFTRYRLEYSWAWQYGYTWVVDYAKANYTSYDRIIVTKKYGEPHEFFLFYWPWSPEKYRNDPSLIRFHQSNWFWVDRFDKFYFVNDWDIPKEENGEWKMENGRLIPTEGRSLLITSPGNYPPGWAFLKTIVFLDGSRAFDILGKVQNE